MPEGFVRDEEADAMHAALEAFAKKRKATAVGGLWSVAIVDDEQMLIFGRGDEVRLGPAVPPATYPSAVGPLTAAKSRAVCKSHCRDRPIC